MSDLSYQAVSELTRLSARLQTEGQEGVNPLGRDELRRLCLLQAEEIARLGRIVERPKAIQAGLKKRERRAEASNARSIREHIEALAFARVRIDQLEMERDDLLAALRKVWTLVSKDGLRTDDREWISGLCGTGRKRRRKDKRPSSSSSNSSSSSTDGRRTGGRGRGREAASGQP